MTRGARDEGKTVRKRSGIGRMYNERGTRAAAEGTRVGEVVFSRPFVWREYGRMDGGEGQEYRLARLRDEKN